MIENKKITSGEGLAPRKDRLGVSKLDYYFSSKGWLFREQYTHDYGIDAQVEIVEGRRPTGNLIAIQVKSGSSYFTESSHNNIVFRTEEKHINYWVQHSLPVIIVLYDPDEDELIWEAVTENTIKSTGKGWKIEIPKIKKLDEGSIRELRKLTQPPEYIKKLNKLRLDKKWIELIAQGECVFVEYEDWIHKSLPRFELKIDCDSINNIEPESWPVLYGPGLSMEEAIEYTLPWAGYEMDYDAHYDYMESVWYDECYLGRDPDTRDPYFTKPFSDWYELPDEITHVSDSGETQGYRLILSLNKIGQAFYDLDNYLSENDEIGHRIFTLGDVLPEKLGQSNL